MKILKIEMPLSIHGVTAKTDSGIMIFINSLLGEADQEEALIHELQHIQLGHLDNNCPLSLEEVEHEARQKTAYIKAKLSKSR